MTTPKEHPILFSGPMIKAIQEGRKTQTRRAIKPQPAGGVRLSPFFPSHLEDGHGKEIPIRFDIGDHLWARETWAALHPNTDVALESVNPRPGICTLAFKATETRGIVGKWRSPLFMPRWASRLTLEVVGLQVQRVQSITEKDAWAEGIECELRDMSVETKDYSRKDEWFQSWSNDESIGYTDYVPEDQLARSSFRTLWDFINAKRGHSWESNPWVWAIEFKRV